MVKFKKKDEDEIPLVRKNYFIRPDQVLFLNKVKKEKKWRSAAQVVRDAIDYYEESFYKSKNKKDSSSREKE